MPKHLLLGAVEGVLEVGVDGAQVVEKHLGLSRDLDVELREQLGDLVHGVGRQRELLVALGDGVAALDVAGVVLEAVGLLGQRLDLGLVLLQHLVAAIAQRHGHRRLHIVQHALSRRLQSVAQVLAVEEEDADVVVGLHALLELLAPLAQLEHLLADVLLGLEVVLVGEVVVAVPLRELEDGEIHLEGAAVLLHLGEVLVNHLLDLQRVRLPLVVGADQVPAVQPRQLLALVEILLERVDAQDALDRVLGGDDAVEEGVEQAEHLVLLRAEDDCHSLPHVLHGEGDLEEALLLLNLQVGQELLHRAHGEQHERLHHHVVGEPDEVGQHQHLPLGQRVGARPLRRLQLLLDHGLALGLAARVARRRGAALALGRLVLLEGPRPRQHVLANLLEQVARLIYERLRRLGRRAARRGLVGVEDLDRVVHLVELHELVGPELRHELVELHQHGQQRDARLVEQPHDALPDLAELSEADVGEPEAGRFCHGEVLEEGDRAQGAEHTRLAPPLRQRDELRGLPGADVHHARRRDGKVLRPDLVALHDDEVVGPVVESGGRAVEEQHLDVLVLVRGGEELHCLVARLGPRRRPLLLFFDGLSQFDTVATFAN
mmetsp:Transcript_5337/g.17247  ORF Transcript_5337/g.17247 Transcript_5337/m.17247 type:complete len:604 (-) Transcript_5337:286-2097(-)